MIDKDFYKNFGPFSLDELALKLDAEIVGDKNKIIFDIAPLSGATDKEVSFYHSSKYKEDFNKFQDAVNGTLNHVKEELLPDVDFSEFDREYEDRSDSEE